MAWSRAIILVDMNAFFASIEQLDFPELQGKPVAVTNGKQGSCIITCSYEARHFGIKTGMRLKKGRQYCPTLIQRPARPKRYAEISTKIMHSLANITPDLEIFSVDEAFLDVTSCQKLYGDPEVIAKLVKQTVQQTSCLTCSVGLSGDKTTAKYAANLFKPDGFHVIPPWEAKTRLSTVPVTELCGIARGIGQFLAGYGVYYCGDMAQLPISVLAKRFGNLGRRIWYMCQGADPEPVHTNIPDPKSMGHGKVIPPDTQDRKVILLYLLHMCEKLSARLRRHDMQAQCFFIGLRSYQWGWIGYKTKLAAATADGQIIYQLCVSVVDQCWHGEPTCQVQVTALDPKPKMQQLDMFITHNQKRELINQTIDEVNQRYGELVIAPARLLDRSEMPNVISPAWRPKGHRQTI